MGGSSDHLTSIVPPSRHASRATIVVLVAFALVAVTLFTPAMATEGGDDLESVRASVLETYNYKIGLLTGLKNETDNGDKIATYQSGITELTELRDTRVATETSIDELRALDDRAHAIYHATVNEANQITSPAEELSKAKRAASETIDYKVGLLRKWIEGCDQAEPQAIVAEGIAKLRALIPKVESSTTPDAALALKDEAHAIYHSTIDAAEKAKDDKSEEGERATEKSEADKAAEALEAARKDTLRTITRKAAILHSAAAAALIPRVVEIYETGAAHIAALEPDAKAATSKARLGDIEDEAIRIYEVTTEAATAVRDDESDGPVDTLATYLESIADYVTFTVEAAAPTAEASPGTFADLASAKDGVLAVVDKVVDASESGAGLTARWDDLEKALSDFRRALVRHYVSLGEPAVVAGVNIPG
jgi:hypothetical protein